MLFLDDASRHVGAIGRAQAEQSAKNLLDTLRGLRKVSKKFALNTAQPIAHYQVSDNWTLQSLLGGTAFKEEWEFVRALSDRSPFSSGLEEGLLKEIAGLELRTRPGNVASSALAWAALLDSATVSFDGHTDWSGAWVETTYSSLDNNGDIEEAEATVRNASQARHAEQHVDWLRLLGLGITPTPSQIWGERTERFSRLRFLPRVEGDLATLAGSGAAFRLALSALESLAKDAADWDAEKAWPDFSTYATAESETRKKLCWVFDDATGKNELFDWHTRFTGGVAGRLHFRVDGATGTIVVAYVGSKLTREISG